VATSFKPPSKSLTLGDLQIIALGLFGVFVLAAALIYSNLNFLNPLGGGGEFYLPWTGGRAFLYESIDPYSAYVPGIVQDLVYERAARAGEEPYILDIPFHLLLLYFPFSLLADPLIARAIFTLLTELAVIALAFLALRLTEWESPGLFLVFFFAFCGLNLYTFQALREAAPILVLGLVYAGILLALRTGSDELAGALLAVACYHWEVGGPFLLLVWLRVLHERRWRVLAGFGMLTFILLAIAFLIYPGWVIPFLRATVNNLRVEYGFSIQSSLERLWPVWGGRLAFGIRILLIISLILEIGFARRSNFRRFYWAACLTMAAAPLLGFRTEIENLAVLILPLALVFAVLQERWRRFGKSLMYVIMLLAFALPWVIYRFGVPRFGELAEEIVYLIWPILTLAGVYWVHWWAIRPPRTWFDRAKIR